MTQEQKEEILKDVKFESKAKTYGGQHAGMPAPIVTLTHPDFDFSVTCGEFRSQLKCREFLITIFELFLEERKR